MISRQQTRQAGKPDARVQGAAAHWGYRFTANGTDYGDFTATLARISRWADWCREWGVTATHYEQLAEAAQDAGQQQTAAGAWQRAALAWHWGKFVFVDDPVQQRAAHERSVACFLKAAPALTPPAELVRIPYGDTTLPAYLRVPAAVGFDNAPVVIMVPGLDSTKEELQATAEYFLARGLATLAIDGPGQGESEYELPIEPAYEKVATAVVDYLQDRSGLDTGADRPVRREPRRLLRRPRRRLREAAAGGRRARRPVPLRPGLGRAARRRRGPPSRPAPARSPKQRPGPRPPSSPSKRPPRTSTPRCSSSAAAATRSSAPTTRNAWPRR